MEIPIYEDKQLSVMLAAFILKSNLVDVDQILPRSRQITEGTVLNIWCWNEEFQRYFNEYYHDVDSVSKDRSTTTLKNGTTVNWAINSSLDNNYQNKFDEALMSQADAAALSDWNKFSKVAAQSKDKGYYDSFRLFSNNVDKPWVEGNTHTVDSNIMAWIEQTNEFTDNGYHHKASLWSDRWMSDQGADEALKASDQMAWVQKVNALRVMAEEVVLREIVYQ